MACRTAFCCSCSASRCFCALQDSRLLCLHNCIGCGCKYSRSLFTIKQIQEEYNRCNCVELIPFFLKFLCLLNKRKEGYIPAFLFNVYTLGTSNLTAAQIKSIQQGYKKLSDFSKVQISQDTQDKGDRILAALESNSFISNDRFTGRFGAGLKAFFTECKDIEVVVNTINLINKENWNKYFTPVAGQSMEAKSYKEALLKLAGQVKE